ncbi:MASE1 domain-containing protein [Streptomyces cocklensis]|uniref:Integral membrane sensor domain MASE1 n=1 Tax=Actinacidiphila cocklensis TaxID=887465 RepID=A0A9W4DRM6_9ACTN|nr:MASE1 domain-containing protein [Actinacidiphila cocklensis]MDD1057247.1 MASE1 domain-containing protein [Actinacidiphila cocklensis]WSX78407.1 MASE1 domain-containing protein [Streptomyces sp. NBC_00899]CAG6394996.1 Integral membrane sensor domain MASE1 [Actinacidiphila cocklensis]
MPVRGRLLIAGQIVVLAAVYYGAAKLGLLQQLVRGQVTPLWPPTGVALTGLLLFGLRTWPGVAVGAFVVNVTLGGPAWIALTITVGNTLAPVAAYLLLRWAGFHNDLDRLRDVLSLIFLAAFGAMLVSSTLGTSALVLSSALDSADFWPTWSVWWTGDAMGVLVVTPFLLVLRAPHRPRDLPPARWAEAAALALCTLAAGYLATSTSHASLLFLAFPVLIWSAFRFQLFGATTCALVFSTLAILAAARQVGPFGHHTLLGNMVTLQGFNGAIALTALLLAVVIIERDRTHAEIQRLCARLTELVGPDLPGSGSGSASGHGLP